jgi:uncharacterized membrane protein YidH (DUF202 family)
MRALRRLLWFRPMTTWSAFVGVVAFIFYMTAGRDTVALVRAFDGGFLLIVVGVVIAVRAYYRDANRRTGEPDRGALPTHVRQISESYILALVYVTVDLWLRAGNPLSWRVPLAALVGVRGLVALRGLIAFERRRVFFVSPYVTDLRGGPKKDRRA